MTGLTEIPWTVSPGSRRVHTEATATETHRLVLTAETPEVAAEVTASHNGLLAQKRAARHGVHMTGVTGVQFGSGNSQTNVF